MISIPSTLLSQPRRRGLFALSALVLLAVAGAAQRADILVGGPERGGPPGGFVVYGRVFGSAPFTFTLNGEEVFVSEDTTWQYTLAARPGNAHLEFELVDAKGQRAKVAKDLLVVPDFEQADDRPIRLVANATQFLAALGSDRVLVLRPGDFVLDALPAGFASGEIGPLPSGVEGVERRAGDGALVLSGLKNLDILGDSGGGSRLVNRTPGGTTLVLNDVNKVRFIGLDLVHEAGEPAAADSRTTEPEAPGLAASRNPGGATEKPNKPGRERRGRSVPFTGEVGGVVRINRSYQVWFRYCEIYGRGVGILAQHSNVVVLDHSTLRDCSSGILRLVNTKHSTFIDSSFLRNGLGRPGDIGVSIEGRERRDNDFVRMQVRENHPGPGKGLFFLDDGAVPVYFLDGEIADNVAGSLRSGPAAKLFKPSGSKVQRF